jgi:hypothetical protein
MHAAWAAPQIATRRQAASEDALDERAEIIA